MVASKLAPDTADNPTIAMREDAPLAIRGTVRGKTTSSLSDLEAKVAKYPEPLRTETRFAQAYFVQHLGSNIDRLRSFAIDQLKFTRSFEYYNNWLKGYYFNGGRSDVKEQGQSDWLSFCKALRDYDTAARTLDWHIKTPTFHLVNEFVLGRMNSKFGGKMGAVCGMTGAQKGASLRAICERLGYPRAARMECSSRQSLVSFQTKLAELYNCKVGNKASTRENELRKAMTPDKLLVIHNLQRAYTPGRKSQPIFEFLIELQEEKDFTLICEFKRDFYADALAAPRRRDKEALAEFKRLTEENREARILRVTHDAVAYFEQLVGRFGGDSEILQLPEFSTAGDLRAIGRHFGLGDSKKAFEYLERWSTQPGRIRVVFRRLERAQEFMTLDRRTTITLDDLAEADTYKPTIREIDGDEGGAS